MSDELALEEELARVPLRRATLRRLVRYARPHAGPLLLGLFLEFVWVVSVSADSFVLRVALDGPVQEHDRGGVVVAFAWLLGNLVFRAAITVYELRITNRVGVAILHDVRRDVFDRLQALGADYFDRTKQGRIIARADRDVDALENLVTWGPVTFVSLLSSIGVGFARLLSGNAFLVPWLLLSLPVLFFVTRTFQRRGFPSYRRVREAHAAVSAHVAESVNGVRVVKAFAAEDRESARLDGFQAAYRRASLHAARVSGGFVPSLSLVVQALLLTSVALGAHRVVDGLMTPGQIIEAVLLFGMVMNPVEGLGGLYAESLVAGAAAERIFLLLDTPADAANPTTGVDPGRLRGDVEWRDVGFAYPGSPPDRAVLRDVSFRVTPGQRVAIVGPTGAGKTTIVHLLARFYAPTAGRILLDGVDLSTISRAALRREVSIVPQENFLFSGTVLHNLRLARPETTEEEAREAFADLGCQEVLAGLSAGLLTEVGERGASLSEGERQILCFVRAHVARPALLLLDEATASVDTRTEALLLRALRALSSCRTTLVVAHRLSTIRDADAILVVEDGRLVETGRHADLLARGGPYARLYAEYARDLFPTDAPGNAADRSAGDAPAGAHQV